MSESKGFKAWPEIMRFLWTSNSVVNNLVEADLQLTEVADQLPDFKRALAADMAGELRQMAITDLTKQAEYLEAFGQKLTAVLVELAALTGKGRDQ